MRPYIEKERNGEKQSDAIDTETVESPSGGKNTEDSDTAEDGSDADGVVEVNGVRKFRLGGYYFDSFHEYRDAKADLEKIHLIESRIDMTDPKQVLRLYNTIRERQIVFRTKIGEDYFSHLGDKVADKSVGLLKDKEAVDTAEKKVRPQRFLGMAVITAAVVLFSYFGFSQLDDYLNTRRLKDLQARTVTEEQDRGDSGKATSEKAAESAGKNPFKSRKKVKEKDLTVLKEYKTLKAENKNLVGWIKIDGTDVNYPVMQSDDNTYYLTHSFDGKNSNAGALFMDYRSDFVNPTTNTIIYGHNMKNGSMFGGLKQYLSESFFNKHDTIQFDTIYEHRQYQIVAVCLAKVKDSEDDTFRYYNFISAKNENEWNAFTESVGAMAVNGSMDVKAGDELLTLSTCNNYIEDGRLFILAKRVE